MKKLSIILLSCLLCAATHAQSGTTGDLSWSISDSTLTISGTGAMPDYHAYSPPPWQYIDSFSNVVIGYGVSSIGIFAFYFGNNFNSITISNSVTTIRNWAFSWGYLISITIPSSVTTIGDYAFFKCYDLTSVTIPNSATYIGKGAFGDCRSLSKIVNHATKPQTIDVSVFEELDTTAITLRVPAASVAAYQAAEVWKEFQIEGF